MKKYFFNTLMVASLFMGLTSCDKTEGPIYNEEGDKISFLSTATSLVMKDGFVNVPVGRTETAESNSFNATLTAAGAGYLNVFKLAGPITFAAGEGKSYAKISYGDFSKIDPSALAITTIPNNDITVGLAFPLTLTIANEDVSYGNKKKIDVLASNVLTFESLGNAKLDSRAGWEEAIVNVEVQKAKGANVYKIKSPFGANSITFMVKSDGKNLLFPNQVITNHPTYGPVSMVNVKGTIEGKVVTLVVGGYTVSAGSFGSGTEVLTLP